MEHDDFEDDRDAPQPIDLDHEEDETIDCPACGRAFYEDAIRCPYCGHWTEEGGSPAEGRARGWFWPIVVAGLVAVILVMWSGLRR